MTSLLAGASILMNAPGTSVGAVLRQVVKPEDTMTYEGASMSVIMRRMAEIVAKHFNPPETLRITQAKIDSISRELHALMDEVSPEHPLRFALSCVHDAVVIELIMPLNAIDVTIEATTDQQLLLDEKPTVVARHG